MHLLPLAIRPETLRGSSSERYELLFELAAGGMGTVYVGRRLGAGGFQRIVAIKRMRPWILHDKEALLAFRDEAQIASLIQHANVVAIHDVHQEGDEQWLIMDYVDGVSLATLLGTLRSLKQKVARRIALRILCDALRGLHAAHELLGVDGEPLEVVHRDATPHNILLGADGSVRLTDFGIARAAARNTLSDPGFAKGKFTYMAPEQSFAEPLDRRADIFTMGVVAWETLTGRRLFANKTIQEVARDVALGHIPAPSASGAACSSELDAIVLKALSSWRENRYPTAASFADALESFAARDSGLAPNSAIAEAVRLACGDVLEERRERIRTAAGQAKGRLRNALPPIRLESHHPGTTPSLPTHDAVEPVPIISAAPANDPAIRTPMAVVAEARAEDRRPHKARRSRMAFALITLSVAFNVGAALRIAASADRILATRWGPGLLAACARAQLQAARAWSNAPKDANDER